MLLSFVRFLAFINKTTSAQFSIIILIKTTFFKFHRLGPCSFGVISALKATVWLLKCLLYLGIPRLLLLLLIFFFNRYFFDILVYRCSSSISKQRFIIKIIVIIFTESGVQPRCLIKESLIKHGFSTTGLSLS